MTMWKALVQMWLLPRERVGSLAAAFEPPRHFCAKDMRRVSAMVCSDKTESQSLHGRPLTGDMLYYIQCRVALAVSSVRSRIRPGRASRSVTHW